MSQCEHHTFGGLSISRTAVTLQHSVQAPQVLDGCAISLFPQIPVHRAWNAVAWSFVRLARNLARLRLPVYEGLNNNRLPRACGWPAAIRDKCPPWQLIEHIALRA